MLAVLGALCASCTTATETTATSTASTAASPAAPQFPVPPGVYLSPADREKTAVDGLYIGFGDPFCCWLAPHARVKFLKPANAKTIELVVEVLDIPKFRIHPAFVDVSAEGKRLVHAAGIRPGVTRIRVDLPTGMKRGIGPYAVEIDSSEFVPLAEHVTNDTRDLGIILKSIGPG